jgi:hypothetical protein
MYMNYTSIIFDTILGAMVLGTISTLSQVYASQPQYFMILGFMWATPLTYFFFINLVSRAGKDHVTNFSRHAIYGSLITFLLAAMVIMLRDFSTDFLIGSVMFLSILSVASYFYLELYNM